MYRMKGQKGGTGGRCTEAGGNRGPAGPWACISAFRDRISWIKIKTDLR